jgi:hypothetical protein
MTSWTVDRRRRGRQILDESLQRLKTRGVADMLIAVTNGLKGRLGPVVDDNDLVCRTR